MIKLKLWFYALLAAVAAALGAYFKGRRSGKIQEKTKQKLREAKALQEHSDRDWETSS